MRIYRQRAQNKLNLNKSARDLVYMNENKKIKNHL